MGSFSIMDPLNPYHRKMKNTKLKLSDLNPHLMCVLCGGYYIDATTIVECLHSFCRSCIVKHLESSKYCPICEVQVHKTKPLINIRPDKTLQDIVYKLVPGLFASEMRNRRRFYKERPHYIKPNNSELVGEVLGDRKIYVNDENITFSLVYHTDTTTTTPQTTACEDYKEISPPDQNEKRYFKCPTGVTIYHLKKLLKTKYDLNDSNYKMEVYLKDQPLHEDLTLLDISYIYLWKNPKASLDFTYKIYENVVKRQKLEEKESQRNIVEPGNVLNDLQTQLDCLPKEVPTNEEKARTEIQRFEPMGNEGRTTEKEEKTNAVAGLVEMAQSNTQANRLASETKPEAVPEKDKTDTHSIKENGVSQSESKEVQLQISESGVMIVSQVEDGAIVRTMEDAPAKVMNNQLITGLSLDSGTAEKVESGEKGKAEVATIRPAVAEVTKCVGGGSKAMAKPVKSYKTIRCSPKTWHPVIPKEKLRPTLMKNTDEPKKPLKFFKMRNMPRFLGNPSSGVKPMYAGPGEKITGDEKKKKVREQATSQSQVQIQPSHQVERTRETTTTAVTATTKNKILKIDPKTLRPIEKEDLKVTQTPNVPNLLTNPFIPNNNHFLFSDLHLLPPHSGNFSNAKADLKGGGGVVVEKPPSVGGFKVAAPNGGYSPVCFPSPDHNPGFYPFSNLTKPQTFPFPIGDKMDPLLRASRLSPFGNLSGFNVAGFHASLPPNISRLLNPHQHFRKLNSTTEKRISNNKDESTKGSTKTTKNCDDSIRGNAGPEVKIADNRERGADERKEEVQEEEQEKEKKEENRKYKEDNRKEKEKSKEETKTVTTIKEESENSGGSKKNVREDEEKAETPSKDQSQVAGENLENGRKDERKEGEKAEVDKIDTVAGEKGGTGGEKSSESASEAISDKSESISESNKSIDSDR